MRDSDDVKPGVTGASDVVRRIANDDRPICIGRSAVLGGEPIDDHSRELEPITCIIAERADPQIQVSVQARYTKLDFRCDTQISGQDSLHEPMLMQRGDGIGGARICRLITGELVFALRHDTGQHLVKPLDTTFCNSRLNTRSDGSIHHDRLIGVTVYPRPREDDGLVLETIRTGDSPSEPTQVGRNQGSIDIPNDQTCVSRTHTQHSGTRPVRRAARWHVEVPDQPQPGQDHARSATSRAFGGRMRANRRNWFHSAHFWHRRAVQACC